MFRSMLTLFGWLLLEDGMHLGKHPDIIILAEGNLSRAAFIRHSALLLHSSTEFLVVLFVHACRITMFALVRLQSTTSLCTSSMDAPPLAKTRVFLPRRNLRSFILLQIELLNTTTSGVESLFELASVLEVVVSLFAGWGLLGLVLGGGVGGCLDFMHGGGEGGCLSGVIRSMLGADGVVAGASSCR